MKVRLRRDPMNWIPLLLVLVFALEAIDKLVPTPQQSSLRTAIGIAYAILTCLAIVMTLGIWLARIPEPPNSKPPERSRDDV